MHVPSMKETFHLAAFFLLTCNGEGGILFEGKKKGKENGRGLTEHTVTCSTILSG